MELYVFPVGQILLYPSFSKPFVVVEEQFIQMIEDSVRSGVPVAVGMVHEPMKTHQYHVGEKLNFVCEIVGYGLPLIVERKADGSLVVFIEGTGKAKLGKVVDRKKPYIVCEAEKIEENHEINPEIFPKFLAVHRIMIDWMNSHISDDRSRDQFIHYIRSPEQVIGCYASYLIVDTDTQQMILDSNDINEKIQLISRIISSKGLVA